MNIKKFLFPAFVSFLLGCSHPSIDATSEASAIASIDKMERTLSAEDKEKFRNAIGYMLYRVLGEQDSPFTPEQMITAMKTLTGKSAGQIIGDAKDMLATEIAEVEMSAKAYNAASKVLSAIGVSSTRYVREITTGHVRTELYAMLRNGTDKPIRSIEFDYKLRTEGRSIPWTEGSGWFIISGGLEPNESREERASGHGIDSDFIVLTSEWQKHPDATLEITVSDARTDSGTSIMGSGVSKASVDRLERLRKISEALN